MYWEVNGPNVPFGEPKYLMDLGVKCGRYGCKICRISFPIESTVDFVMETFN